MSDNTFFEDQCMLSFTAFGACRQQEALTPDMMTLPFSAEGYEAIIFTDGSGSVAFPGVPVFLPLTVTSVRIVANSFSTDIRISNVEPSLFKEDYYTFDILYIFTFKVELYNAAGILVPVELDTSPTPTIQNFLTVGVDYTFKGELCGGHSQDVVASTNFLAPNVLYDLSVPYVRVVSKASPLEISLETICPEDICSLLPNISSATSTSSRSSSRSSSSSSSRSSSASSLSSSSLSRFGVDPYDPYDHYPANVIRLSIGIFAVYELIRPVTTSVPAILQTNASMFESEENNGCYPPSCAKLDPCEYFKSMPFPFTDFDPDDC